jgi:hypothetical protein
MVEALFFPSSLLPFFPSSLLLFFFKTYFIAAATIARPSHRAQWTWEEDDELVGMVHREGHRNDDWEGKASRFSSRRSGKALSHRWYLLRAQGLDGVGSARKASKAMPKAKKRHKYK